MLANSLDYYLLDVFTERAFAGNPLAVFPHAQGLDIRRMQAIANELNLSETVFVGQAREVNCYPMRIFTPTRELPFAGHPTVGTAHLLAELELASREWPLILEAGVGSLEVRFEDGLARFTTTRPVEIGTSTLDRVAAAELLGLNESQVIGEPVLASCGLAYHLVELDSLEALERALPAPVPWAHSVSPSGIDNIYLYVTAAPDSLRARMFSMEGSLREDPATGSAAAALAGTLAVRRPGVGKWQWWIDQGVEMGRPSRIHAMVERDDDHAMTIRIAGQSVIVGRGTLLQ
ncbi:MAG TPA: PhzF family phenazine biosynthesis protein [Modicisalibacter sp.]|nr:PhzF family phenazine biosynthesis protein [Modicisalibacter sp.]